MRALVILLLGFVALFGSDLVYCQVTTDSGGDLVGWFDRDCRVMYLGGDQYVLVRHPKGCALLSAPSGSAAPVKRTFKKMPDPPYGRVLIGGKVYTGWLNSGTPSGTLYTEPEVSTPIADAKMIEELPAPGPMPQRCRDLYDSWCVANAATIDQEQPKP
jgi:hypothetical protein